MLKINVKTIIRNILKNPGLSIIKIFGLSIGIACSILVFIYVRYELSYDKFNKNADRIYRIAVEGLIGNTEIYQTYTCAPLPKALYDEFPEIESVVRITQGNFTISYGEKEFFEKDQLMADSTIFDVFTFQFLKGDPKNALTEPYSIVITESYATKYFGNDDPINKSVKLGNDMNAKITGIIKDVPDNSHFHFDFIVSLNSFNYSRSNSWWNNNFRAYIMLKEKTDYKQLEAKFPEFIAKYFFSGNDYNNWVANGNKWDYYLQPLTSIHLNSDLSGELEPNGNIRYVHIFIIIGIFILIIACINYMNLTTAHSANRANEIGIKKVNGSRKWYLVFQFINESILMTFIAMCMAIAIVKILLPLYNNLLNRNLNFNLFDDIRIVPTLLILVIIVGFISGSYPAFFLSSLKSVKVLKGGTHFGAKSSGFRNVLVVLQFSISVALIVGTLFVNKQLNFIKNERLGFNKDHVLIIKNSGLLDQDHNYIKEQLLKSPYIEKASFSHTIPGYGHNNIGFSAEQIEGWFTLNVCVCDADYADVMQLSMAEGRFFSEEREKDINSIVINEATANLCGYEDGPIGKIFSGRYEVIGVVKDFHYESMHMKVRPMVFINVKNRNWMRPSFISLKTKGQFISETIKHAKNVWEENSNYPFEYSFLDTDYDELYKNEQHTSSLLLVFSILAIFIACLGLIGLSTFTVEQRIKEIGVRKVNGAKELQLVSMLNRNFTKWVIISYVIACPIAFLLIKKWLQSFAYHIELTWWIFAIAGIIALIIALLTVSIQTWQAATKNPIEALRYE